MKRVLHYSNLKRQFKYYFKLQKRGDFSKYSKETVFNKLRKLYFKLKDFFSPKFLKTGFAAALLFGAVQADAQNLLFQSPPAQDTFGLAPTPGGQYAAPTFADIDGDGDFDMISGDSYIGAYYNNGISFFENIGSATNPSFAPAVLDTMGLQMPYGSFNSVEVHFIDFDSDGDFDVLASDRDGDFFYWENVGTTTVPSFSPAQVNPFDLVGDYANSTWVSIDVADIDADGDMDIFLGDGGTNGFQFLEDTSAMGNPPSFNAGVTNPFGLTDAGYYNGEYFPNLADVDNDGDLDMLAGIFSGSTYDPYTYTGIPFSYVYYENTGTPTAPQFGAPSTDPFGLVPQGYAGYYGYYPGNITSTTPTLVDLDGDGDLDLMSGHNENTYYPSGFLYYENIFLQNVWEGTTSTDWSDPTNWSEATVPTAADVVLIPDMPVGGLFPTTTSNIEVGNLNVQPLASLEIGAGLGLIIADNGNVNNNGAISLKSSPTSSAWLDDFSNTNTSFSGNITVEQAVTAGSGLGQRLVGSPVAGGVIAGIDATYAGAGANGQVVMSDCLSGIPDVGTPYSNLFEWQEDASSPNNCEYEGWFAIDAASSLTDGRAYSAWLQDGSTISFTGAPNTDDINYGGGTLGNSASGVAAKDGWHLLANPYPSAVDVSDLTATQGWASLSTYNAASAPAGGTYQPIMPGQNLGSVQGFAAQTTTSPSFLGDVVFDNTMRVAGNETLKANDDWFISKLDIAVNGPETQDFSYLYFNDEASAAFDNVWDCEKRSSIAGKATLFTSLDERPLSLNGNNIQDLGTTSYPLGLTPAVSGAYEFVFNGLETFDGEFEILLEDKLTDSWTNLRTDNNYSFEMSTADHNDRFEIHFNKTATGVNDLLAGQATVRATATDIVVTLDGVDADNAASVQVYDAVGQIVSSIDNAGQLVNIDMTQNAHGIYFVSVSIGSAQNTFKVIY